jgi:hypothetical protein
MRARALLLLAAGLAGVACQREAEQRPATDNDSQPPVADSGPPPPDARTPLFAIGLWPGDGIQVIHAARDSVAVHAEPLVRSAAVGTLAARANQVVEYDSTQYQTVASARATSLTPVTLEGRDFGDIRFLSRAEYHSAAVPRRTMQLDSAAVVEYLQARAKGTCFVRVNERVMELDACVLLDRSKFTVQGEPDVMWWIHAANAGGTPGWVIVSDSTARVVNRRF